MYHTVCPLVNSVQVELVPETSEENRERRPDDLLEQVKQTSRLSFLTHCDIQHNMRPLLPTGNVFSCFSVVFIPDLDDVSSTDNQEDKDLSEKVTLTPLWLSGDPGPPPTCCPDVCCILKCRKRRGMEEDGNESCLLTKQRKNLVERLIPETFTLHRRHISSL